MGDCCELGPGLGTAAGDVKRFIGIAGLNFVTNSGAHTTLTTSCAQLRIDVFKNLERQSWHGLSCGDRSDGADAPFQHEIHEQKRCKPENIFDHEEAAEAHHRAFTAFLRNSLHCFEGKCGQPRHHEGVIVAYKKAETDECLQ